VEANLNQKELLRQWWAAKQDNVLRWVIIVFCTSTFVTTFLASLNTSSQEEHDYYTPLDNFISAFVLHLFLFLISIGLFYLIRLIDLNANKKANERLSFTLLFIWLGMAYIPLIAVLILGIVDFKR
jgi:nitrogen fixation/metabolism regulation signal transduction histidine kinase